MKLKVSEATNNQLDWMVAKAQGIEIKQGSSGVLYCINNCTPNVYAPTQYWSQGGPIIEREIHAFDYMQSKRVCAIIRRTDMRNGGFTHGYGPTPLIAAMIAYVTFKLGDEVEVPDGLA